MNRYIAFVHRAQSDLAQAFGEVGERHSAEVDVFHTTNRLAQQCEQHVAALRPVLERYGTPDEQLSDRLFDALSDGDRSGSDGLIRDLIDLYLMASEVDIVWTALAQAAQGARDEQLLDVVGECESDTSTQLLWLRSRIKQAAPQTMLIGAR